MAGTFVALPLSGSNVSRAGFLPAGGLADGTGTPTGEVAQIRHLGPPRPTLVVAGCDPALPLLQTRLSLLDPPIAFSWWPCFSQQALTLADAELVHAAGTHLPGQPGHHGTDWPQT